MKYSTEEGLRKLRVIAERAYVRGSETCKVSPIALLAVLDEIKAVEQKMHPTLGESTASDSESTPAPKQVI